MENKIEKFVDVLTLIGSMLVLIYGPKWENYKEVLVVIIVGGVFWLFVWLFLRSIRNLLK